MTTANFSLFFRLNFHILDTGCPQEQAKKKNTYDFFLKFHLLHRDTLNVHEANSKVRDQREMLSQSINLNV